MQVPTNIESLIDDRIIEGIRIEYKTGWNPEKILHTICAFANDIENRNGGYVIIGIREENERPAEVIGVSENEAAKIDKELHGLCNLINPRFFPVYSVEKYHGKDVFVIYVLTGRNRPYKCPVNIGDRQDNERAYYIRRGSNTIRANHAEELDLLSKSGQFSFDESENYDARTNDIKPLWVRDYLVRVKSRMVDGGALDNFEEVVKSMHLVCGPPEALRPINVALMMFSDRPDDFFSYAWIDVVIKPDPTGEKMEERSFKGPVYSQAIGALDYIRNNVIAERVYKLQDRAEAIRVFNYPYEAVEEAVINAIYHKDYRIREQITVTVTPEYLEVKSFPGPDCSISDEDVKNLNMKNGYYRNKRLGDYLRELRLTEGRNTGIPKMLRTLENNGSEPPQFITDPERTCLRVVIPIHERFRPDTEIEVVHSKVVTRKKRTGEEIKDGILDVLRMKGCLPTREIFESLGYNGPTRGFYNALRQLLEDGEVEYLYPDNPRDSRQRICLPKRKTSSRTRDE